MSNFNPLLSTSLFSFLYFEHTIVSVFGEYCKLYELLTLLKSLNDLKHINHIKNKLKV